MNMKPNIQVPGYLILAGLFAIGTAKLLSAEQAASSPPILRVGIAANIPPMAYKEGGKIVGVEPELAQILGRELGRTIKFVELPFADLIDSLEAGKIDIIMSSMSVTRARQMRVAFSDPYLRIGQMSLVRTDEKFKYATLLGNSLSDRKIGVKRGTTGDLLAQQEFPRAKRKYFESGDDAAQALAKKKIDLYFSDATMIWYLAGKYEARGLTAAPFVFSDETLAWAMRRSDADLLAAVNKALQRLNSTGELKQVVTRWIPRFQ